MVKILLRISMKKLISILSILLVSSCEYATLKYGYYWNPITVLSKADESIAHGSVSGLINVLSGKALCEFASEEGIINLQETLAIIPESSFVEPKLFAKKHLAQPDYRGFWVYYQEFYKSYAFDMSGNLALDVTITCHIGSSQHKTELLNNSVSKYDKKFCQITDIKNLYQPRFEEVCRNL